jgi:phosphatidylinositol-3-phosphatase
VLARTAARLPALVAVAMSRFARSVLVLALVAVVSSGPSASVSAAAIPRFGHAFLIVGENTSYEQITPVHAPFLTGPVKAQGAWLRNMHSFLKSSSLGQYIAMLSGQFTACEANNDLPDHCHQRAPNLFSQLTATGRGWRDYQQSMPNACDPVDGGAAWARDIYSAHHNPALYFTRIQGARVDEAITPSRPCRQFDLPMGSTAPDDTSFFDQDLATGRVGSLNVVVPNDCADGHDVCGTHDRIRQFDDFLASEVPKIQAAPAFGPDGVIFITWDEGSDPPFHPGHVLTAVLGPQVRPGAIDRLRHDHYGLERTLAAGLGLTPLAHARTATPITTIWR